MIEVENKEELDHIAGEIAAFEEEVLGHWVAEENLKDYYLLRAAFGRARETIAFTQKKLAA